MGMSVLVKVADRPGWSAGVLQSGSGAVVVDGEVVPPHRIRAITHHPRGRTPHEAPVTSRDTAYFILLTAIFFPGQLRDVEDAVGWRDSAGRLRGAAVAATPSGLPADP